MKTLKMGLLGLAVGVVGALAFPAPEAAAQMGGGGGNMGGGTAICCSTCNPTYSACLSRAGNNTSSINKCVSARASCESYCSYNC